MLCITRMDTRRPVRRISTCGPWGTLSAMGVSEFAKRVLLCWTVRLARFRKATGGSKLRPRKPNLMRTDLARQLGTTDMSFLRYTNRQSSSVGAIPDIELLLHSVIRISDVELKMRKEFPKFFPEEKLDSHSGWATGQGKTRGHK